MKKNTLFLILSAILATILISCPLPAPMSSSQVQDLLISPPAPSNVSASMFMKDRIELTWDEVESADGYIIMMVDSGVYADNMRKGTFDSRKQEGLEALTRRGFMQVDTKAKGEVSSVLTNRRIVPGNHYVFAVVSFKDYGGLRKYSASSEYVEGGTIGVINSLKELVYPTGVKISWGCPSMESVLEFGPDGEPGMLYEHYDFTVSFQEVGPNTPVIAAASVGDSREMSAMIPLKGEDLAGAPYELRPCIKADRNDATAKDTIIQYEFWVTLNVYSSPEHTPDSLIGSSGKNMSVIVEIWPSGLAPEVTDLSLNAAPHADDIEVSWREPYVTGVADYRSVYRIERQKDGEADWEMILDETMPQEAVKKDGYGCVFNDTSADKNTDYRYRVTFGYSYPTPSGTDMIVMQTGDIPVTDGMQHMIWVPTDAVLRDFSPVEGSEGLTANAVFTWNIPGSDEELQDAEWYAVPSRWSNSDSSVTELPSVNLTGVTVEDGSVTASFPVSIEPEMKETLNIFSFVLGYRNGDAEVEMPVALADGVTPKLGTDEKKLFEDLRASVNRVGEVELSWRAVFGDEEYDDTRYERGYAYQIDGGRLIEDLPDMPVKGDDGRYRVSIGGEDLPEGKTSWEFRMTVSQGLKQSGSDPNPSGVKRYTNPLPVTGSVLPVPVISATQGTDDTKITVTVEDGHDPELEYEISWAPKAESSDEAAWTVIADGGRELPKAEGNMGEVISFRARARNTMQGADAPYTDWSETADGAVFGGAGIVLTAEQGMDPEKIKLSWTPAMGAESYRVMRRPVAAAGAEPYEWKQKGSKPVTKLTLSDNISTEMFTGMDELIPLSEKYEYMIVPLRADITGTDSEGIELNRERYDAVEATCHGNVSEGWLFMPPREQYVSKGDGGTSNVYIAWTEVPNATSYTIQSYTYRVVEHSTEVGEPTVELVPEWSPGEAQHVDVDAGLADGFLQKTVTEDGKTFFHMHIPGTTEGRFYSIRANNGRISVKSLFQKKFPSVMDEVGNDVPSNYGYAFSTDKIASFEAQNVMNDGLYADYIQLRWKRARGADSYTLYASDGVSADFLETRIDVASLDLTARNADGQVTNGKAKNVPGYLMYDPADDTFTYNDDSGTLRRSNSITDYRISGSCRNYYPTEKKLYMGPYRLYRQLKPEEAINITNSALAPHIQAADNKFGHDWFQGWTRLEYSSADGSFSVRIKGAPLTFNYDESFITLKDMKAAGMTLNAERILLRPMNSGNYLEDNSLNAIGHGGDSEDPDDRWSIVTLTAPGFRTYRIWYTNIGKSGGTMDGMYKVDDGTGAVEIKDGIEFERPF